MERAVADIYGGGRSYGPTVVSMMKTREDLIRECKNLKRSLTKLRNEMDQYPMTPNMNKRLNKLTRRSLQLSLDIMVWWGFKDELK